MSRPGEQKTLSRMAKTEEWCSGRKILGVERRILGDHRSLGADTTTPLLGTGIESGFGM